MDDVSESISHPLLYARARAGFRVHASHSNSLHTVIKRRTRPPEEEKVNTRWQLELAPREIKSLLELARARARQSGSIEREMRRAVRF